MKHIPDSVEVGEVWQDAMMGKTRYIRVTDVFEEDDDQKSVRIRYEGYARSQWPRGARFPKNSTMKIVSLFQNYKKMTPEEAKMLLTSEYDVKPDLFADLFDTQELSCLPDSPSSDEEPIYITKDELAEALVKMKQELVTEIKEIFLS